MSNFNCEKCGENALVWVSDFGSIDVTQFNHLKFRKDGWFDCRRSRAYYKELKEYIRQKEHELAGAVELVGIKQG